MGVITVHSNYTCLPRHHIMVMLYRNAICVCGNFMDMLDSDDSNERWLPIGGFPGYEVSDLGRVRSLARKANAARNISIKGKILTGTIINGYPRVTLRRDGKTFYREIHRLVALAFLGPCPDGEEVRHVFGNSKDARLSGLRYGTRAQNIAYSKRHG